MFSKIQYNAKVTLSFTLISFIVLMLNYIPNANIMEQYFAIYRTSPYDPLQYLRLFTHVLGSGSLEHYSSNIMIFLLIAPMLEEKYGSINLLLMIVITAFVTGLVALLAKDVMTLGSSGIVFMLITLSSFTSYEKGKIPLTAIVVSFIYLGKELVGLFADDDISQMSHIVGGILGLIFVKIFSHRDKSSKKNIIKKSIEIG